MYRQHPLMILQNLKKYIILLVFPIARVTLRMVTSLNIVLTKGLWIDLTILIFIVLIEITRWLLFRFSFDENSIRFKQGIFFEKKSEFKFLNIACITIETPFFYLPFYARSLLIDTDAGSRKKSDFKIIINKKISEEIKNIRDKRAECFKFSYKTRGLYIAVLSGITSNSFVGILFISVFISNVGKLLGEQFKQLFYDTFTKVSEILAFGTTPVTAAIVTALIIGWLFTFIRNLINLKSFTVNRDSETLKIKGGVLTKREHSILPCHINYIDIRQTVITKLLRLYLVFISASGYGKNKGGVSPIIPAATKHEAKRNLKVLIPNIDYIEVSIKPKIQSFFRYVSTPVYSLLILCSSVYLLDNWLLKWEDIVVFVRIMLIIACSWWLIFRTVCFFTSGIGVGGNSIVICSQKGFVLHKLIIPKNKIAFIEIKRTLFQRFGKTCDVYIYPRNEKKRSFKVKSLNYKKIVEIID